MCSPRLVLGQCTQHSGFFSVLPAPTPYFIAYYVTEKGIRLKFRAHGEGEMEEDQSQQGRVLV